MNAPPLIERASIDEIRARAEVPVFNQLSGPKEYYRVQQLLRDRADLLSHYDELAKRPVPEPGGELKEQLALAHEAVWAVTDDGYLYHGTEGMNVPQQLVNDYTERYPITPGARYTQQELDDAQRAAAETLADLNVDNGPDQKPAEPGHYVVLRTDGSKVAGKCIQRGDTITFEGMPALMNGDLMQYKAPEKGVDEPILRYSCMCKGCPGNHINRFQMCSDQKSAVTCGAFHHYGAARCEQPKNHSGPHGHYDLQQFVPWPAPKSGGEQS